MLKKIARNIFYNLPPVKNLLQYKTKYPIGHYYNPIPDHDLGVKITTEGLNKVLPTAAVNLRDEEQLKLFEELVQYMKTSTFRNLEKVGSHRFYNDNGFYGYSDALFLESMIRHLKPKRIIEGGSGFSSILMLDVNKKYFDNSINITFIEPFPEERLLKLLTEDDKKFATVISRGLQEVPLSEFKKLQANDILFIDSSHIAKIGSDLIYLFFEIIPALNPGVYIHFHDIFNNFEYVPSHFDAAGFGHNECYFLRAFLMYNDAFDVVLFSNYLDTKYKDKMLSLLPDYPLFKGAQFWMKKK